VARGEGGGEEKKKGEKKGAYYDSALFSFSPPFGKSASVRRGSQKERKKGKRKKRKEDKCDRPLIADFWGRILVIFWKKKKKKN